MMSALSGKKAFEAMGRRAASLNNPFNYFLFIGGGNWQKWAIDAFQHGFDMQRRKSKRTLMGINHEHNAKNIRFA
jgi:hypothetical protein